MDQIATNTQRSPTHRYSHSHQNVV